MNTNEPFRLESQEIKKQDLKNMFIGIKGTKESYEGTLGVKLYKQTN